MGRLARSVLLGLGLVMMGVGWAVVLTGRSVADLARLAFGLPR